MKMKNMWKRFWTLDVHNHAGFTLVELIIVIAILAILSTGAIAGYSAYIKSANITTDKALIAEIENVLMLAAYSGSIKADDSATIVVTVDGAFADPEGGNIVTALIDAYGNEWQSALRLNYVGWHPGVFANSELMNYVNNSNFNQDSLGSLLNSVQYVTGELTGALAGGSVSIDPNSALGQYLTNAGIDYVNDPQAASNAAVLYVGSAFANSNASEQEIANAWMTGDYSAICGDDLFAQTAAQYAATLAMAKYIDGKYDTDYADQLDNATGTEIISVMGQVQAQLGTYESDIAVYYGVDGENVGTSSMAYTDAMAFQAYMAGVDAESDSLLNSTNLSSNTYFTDGYVENRVNSYINMGDLMATHGVENGVVIVVVGDQIEVYMTDSAA